ncbi:MAG: 6-O-methylguanine DNA methyltransferase, DNA binding domain [Microgenomates bacterium OLB22]|nr:MAG: 6-O-methylguanine DNA methyltransferase, DNA binding domain [Microgenomates bacterium OLB22]
MSYGQVALYAGSARAARQVGWILNQVEETVELPWWRVVNNQGRLTIKGSKYTPTVMRQFLEAEGVMIRDDYTLDIEEYRHKPTDEDMQSWELPEAYINYVNTKV